MTGTVKFFNESKGYGFITNDESSEDVFVHVTALNGLSLQEGDKVEYTEEDGNKGIRVTIDTGGCSGMSYKITFEGEQKEFDKVFDSHGVTIFCDVKSWIYVRGCEIDFSTDLLNGGFKVNNPNATRTCGCGISFSA